MSDPRYTDPPHPDEPRFERAEELQRSSNAMWGWIAGGAALAVLLVFLFARAPDGTDTAGTTAPEPPAATTSIPRSAPETTGQGASPTTPPATTPAPAPAPSAPPAQ